MARIKRVVRKLGQARESGFDSQFWPVVVALCVLTSFVLGAVLTLFRGPMLWLSLMLMPAGLAASIIVLASISHRRVRRTLQLAIILSMIVHIAFILSAYRVDVFERFLAQDTTRSRTRESQTIRVPVEVEQQQPWERVNVTETPEVETPLPEIEPEPQEETPERPQPTPVERQFDAVDPNRVERSSPARTSPKFSPQQSELSRNQQNQPLQSSSAAEELNQRNPEQTAEAQNARDAELARNRSEAETETERPSPAAPETEANVSEALAQQRVEPDQAAPPDPQAELAQRENPRPQPQLQVDTSALVQDTPTDERPNERDAESSTAAIADATPLPRRRTPTPSPTIDPRADRAELPSQVNPNLAQTEQPRPNRRQRQTSEPESALPATELTQNPERPNQRPDVTPTPATSAEVEVAPQRESVAQETTPAPADRMEVQRERPDANRVTRRSLDPTDSPSVAVEPSTRRSDNATRQPQAADAPEIAQADSANPRPRLQTEVTTSSDVPALDVETDASTLNSTQLVANPTSDNVTRQPESTPTTERTQNALPENTTGLATQVPRISPSSSPDSTQPSIATNQPSDIPRRTLNEGDVAQTPTNAESPTEASSTSGNELTLSPPEQFALNRATGGTAGAGDSRNLDRDVPANERPAIAPSNSAERPESTSRDPGQSFQPSEPSQLRQSLAGEFVPSSTVEAVVEDGVGIPASEPAANLAAQSSATPIESRSPAERGDVSALRGSSTVDMGPPKIVANEFDGRGAGGGQVDPHAESSPAEAENADRGSLQSSIASNDMAELPQAPREDGNTGTLEVRENPNADALARSRADGAEPVQGGPSPSELTGPTELASEAFDIDSSPLVRADASDAVIDDPVAGGGDLDEDDEEERERRRRLAESGGGDVGQLAIQTEVELPAGVAGDANVDPTALTESFDAGSTEAARDADASERLAEVGQDRGQVEASEPGADDDAVSQVELARGEMSDGVESPAAPGGGTLDARRRSTPAPAVSGEIDLATITSTEPGTDDGAPAAGLEAADTEATRIAGSVEGVLRSTIGTVASQLMGPSMAAIPPVVIGPSGQPREPGAGETAGESTSAGAPARRDAVSGPQTETQIEVDLAGLPGVAGDASGGERGDAVSNELNASGRGQLRRSEPRDGGVEIDVAADDGPGGLGQEVTPQVGVDDRRARLDDGPLQEFADSRFIRDDAGGVPTFNPSVTLPSDAFRSRQPLGGGRGSPQTEEAIEMGLAFLERHQQPEGHWKLETFGSGTGDENDETPVFRSDTAATGLALLAFQGAGYNHKEYKYAAQVNRAVQWLVDHQDDEGCLYVTSDEESNKYSRLYSHGIAALALCEAYGMTQDPALRAPAQRALDYIVNSQDKERGGWRYIPGRASDTSVSGWMMMALKSGEFAGLEVPESTYRRFSGWLDTAQVRGNPHQYSYNPYAADTPEQRHGREASRSMTSVALLMRLYMGWDRERDEMRRGSDYLLERLPADSSSLVRDTYYWYYATQVLRHMGGERWEQWNEKLHPLLITTQIREPRRVRPRPLADASEIVEDNSLVGSWDPLQPVPDAWGITGGRIYVTALNLLSLEVDYRLMPLYKNTVE